MIATRFNPLGKRLEALTAKDYIQDGLIAMWDAIENVGFGLHEDAPTEWKDLIGTRHLPIGTSGVTFSTDRAHFVGNAIQETSGAFTNQFREAVFNSSTNGWVVNTYRNTRNALWCKDGLIGASYYYPEKCIVYDWESKTVSASIGRAEDETGKYLNGLPATEFEDYGNTYFTPTGVALGRGIVGYICIVRLYNRALTAEEVAHNYAIDKERFGL